MGYSNWARTQVTEGITEPQRQIREQGGDPKRPALEEPESWVLAARSLRFGVKDATGS